MDVKPLTDSTVVPDGMPTPATSSPTTSPVVVVMLVTVADPSVTVPAKYVYNTSLIVAPAGTPVPLTAPRQPVPPYC